MFHWIKRVYPAAAVLVAVAVTDVVENVAAVVIEYDFPSTVVTSVADDKVEEIVAMVHLQFVGNTVNPVKEKVVGVVSKEKVAVTVVAYC